MGWGPQGWAHRATCSAGLTEPLARALPPSPKVSRALAAGRFAGMLGYGTWQPGLFAWTQMYKRCDALCASLRPSTRLMLLC